jgi:hypothetical protein
MKRRKFILGTGVFAAGSAGAIQTSAFTSVSAQRDVEVAVASDESALLRLAPCSGSPNRGYVTGTDDGQLSLALSSDNPTDEGGEGVNPDATTVINDVFEICNQGTQPVGVWLNIDPVQNGNGDDAISLYQDGDQSLPIVGQDNAVCLGVGDCVCIGIVTRTQGIDADTNLLNKVAGDSEMVVNADADVSCSPPLSGEPRRLDTGTADWKVTELPSEVSPPSGESLSYDARVVNPPSAWDTSNTAEWVDPFGDGGLQGDPVGDYAYELDFEVVAGSRELVIEAYGADNPVEFFLDGTSIGGFPGEEAYDPLRSDIPNQTVLGGNHTLRAEVENQDQGSPTGLLVAARLE